MGVAMLKTILLMVCALGMASCWCAFRDEYRTGKLYPSLLIASIGWTVGFFAALAFMEWE